MALAISFMRMVLPVLGLSHDERTLTLTDWREEIYDAGAEIGGLAVATEIELR